MSTLHHEKNSDKSTDDKKKPEIITYIIVQRCRRRQ